MNKTSKDVLQKKELFFFFWHKIPQKPNKEKTKYKDTLIKTHSCIHKNTRGRKTKENII